MKQKKVYKLKTWPKVLIVIIIGILLCSPFAYKKYQEYLYTKTDEYALLQIGYSEEQTANILKILKEDEIKKIKTYEYNEFIPEFIKCKYFMFKNLDSYLDQVITQEDDFFKYHGVDGYDYDDIVAKVNVHVVRDYYTDTYKTDLSKGYGILVNKYFELGSEYAPDDLVDVSVKYYYGDPKKIRSEAYEKFKEMWDDANKEGIYLIIVSGYRDYQSQEEVYRDYENSKGTSYADSIAARPGFSEHQTGLSLDIYSKESTSAKTFKDSKTYEWLINNSYKYGFILRYPDKKSKITGYNYESWHYRYLGVDLATKVYNEGITYDEYYAYYLDN